MNALTQMLMGLTDAATGAADAAATDAAAATATAGVGEMLGMILRWSSCSWCSTSC